MLFPSVALAASLWASTTLSQPLNPSSRPFYLHTQLKPDQPGKDRFDNLWLYAYHTGAGLNDAMLSGNKTHAIAGSLTASNITTTPGGDALYGVGFDLGGTGLSWGLGPQIGVNTYAAWQPVRIDAGGAAAGEYSAFYVDGNGLQWTTGATGIPDSFGGWFGEFGFAPFVPFPVNRGVVTSANCGSVGC